MPAMASNLEGHGRCWIMEKVRVAAHLAPNVQGVLFVEQTTSSKSFPVPIHRPPAGLITVLCIPFPFCEQSSVYSSLLSFGRANYTTSTS